MRSVTALDRAVVAMMAAIANSPAIAGVPPSPGPVAGTGIGAVALMGMGYRAIKRRLDK